MIYKKKKIKHDIFVQLSLIRFLAVFQGFKGGKRAHDDDEDDFNSYKRQPPLPGQGPGAGTLFYVHRENLMGYVFFFPARVNV